MEVAVQKWLWLCHFFMVCKVLIAKELKLINFQKLIETEFSECTDSFRI